MYANKTISLPFVKPVKCRHVEDCMKTDNTPIDTGFRQVIESLTAQRKYVGIHYISDIQELLNVTAIIKEIYSKEGIEYVKLSTGEEIRLDKIVRADGHGSPDYPGYDFSYNCSI